MFKIEYFYYPDNTRDRTDSCGFAISPTMPRTKWSVMKANNAFLYPTFNLARLRVQAACVCFRRIGVFGGGERDERSTRIIDHWLPLTGSRANGRVRQTESNLTRSDEWSLICEASNFAKVSRASIEGGHAFVPRRPGLVCS